MGMKLIYVWIAVLLVGCAKPGTEEHEKEVILPDGVDYPESYAGAFPDKVWGAYGWGGSAANRFCRGVKGTNTTVLWSEIEPEEGDFRFDEVIGTCLEAFRKQGMYTFLKIYVAPLSDKQYNSPRWLFEEKDVPIVEVSSVSDPFGEPLCWKFPWYLDETYVYYQYRMIRAFGEWLRALPEELLETVLFVQSAEGCTSDGQAYKGTPLVTGYRLSQRQWNDHRREVWDRFRMALTDPVSEKMVLPLAVNYDSNTDTEYAWMEQNLGDAMGLKNGMFSHGYDICDEIQRKEQMDDLRERLRAEGKQLFIRGEQDKEWRLCGWSVRNPEQAFYWSAIYASHCGLDLWNFPSDACANERFAPAIDFFNKYAGPHRAVESTVAFCALRQGLNAADTEAYPESEFGEARRDNLARYEAIVARYAARGAMQGDPDKAAGTNMQNRQRSDYNDAGWNIFPGNYRKFLRQIDANETSVGWWHVDRTIYGCFARGFDHANGRSALYFALEEGFGGNRETIAVCIDVTYLDRGTGRWSLCCVDGDAGVRTICTVTNTDSGHWQVRRELVRELNITGAGPRGCHFFLRYESGDDTLFHLVEVAYSGELPDFGTEPW